MTEVAPQDERPSSYVFSVLEDQPAGIRITVHWQSRVRIDNGRLNEFGEVWIFKTTDMSDPNRYDNGAYWEGDWYIRVWSKKPDSEMEPSPYVLLFPGVISTVSVRKYRSGVYELFFGSPVGKAKNERTANNEHTHWRCPSMKEDGTGNWEPV